MTDTQDQLTGSLGGTFDIITVGGADACNFLHGQLTCDVRELSPQRAMMGAFLTPRGRVFALLLLLSAGERYHLLTHPSLTDSLIDRLRMFVLRSKVTIESAAELTVRGAIGREPDPTITLDSLRASQQASNLAVAWPGGSTIELTTADAGPAIDAEWQTRDAQIGMPWVEAASSDRHVAQMLNLDRYQVISFKKGCFPGQEVIARVHYLGSVKRRLHRYSAQTPLPPATALSSDRGEPAGEVLCSGPHRVGRGHPILAVVTDALGQEKLLDEQTGTVLEPVLVSRQPNIV